MVCCCRQTHPLVVTSALARDGTGPSNGCTNRVLTHICQSANRLSHTAVAGSARLHSGPAGVEPGSKAAGRHSCALIQIAEAILLKLLCTQCSCPRVALPVPMERVYDLQHPPDDMEPLEDYYEWRDEQDMWYCKKCWTYVTAGHMMSVKHVYRIDWARGKQAASSIELDGWQAWWRGLGPVCVTEFRSSEAMRPRLPNFRLLCSNLFRILPPDHHTCGPSC